MPKVSVVMAVYNDGCYVREAIDSILRQTFEDFEFIIVNDASTDNTKDILLSYQDQRIQVIDNHENFGIPRSLNKGLKLTQGKYIARHDGDDISEPERLAKQVAFLEANPDICLVGTWYKKIDSQGNCLGNREVPCDCTDLRWDLLFYCPFAHSTIMFERSRVMEKTGGYNEAFRAAQDYDFWSRIARELPVANLNEYLVKYRVNPSSITSTRKKEQDHQAQTIQKTNIQCLWDVDPSQISLNEMDTNIMTALLIGAPTDPHLQNLPKVHQTVNSIFKLQNLFCRYYNLSPKESQSHLKKLSTHLSRRLIDLADYSFTREKYNIVSLLTQAYNLDRLITFSWKNFRLILKMLIGPTFVKTIQRLSEKRVN